MTVKRPLEDDTAIENMAMANCLMLLSKVGKPGSNSSSEPGGRLFHCKTCNKPFQSFQALGGHRASHKRPKLTELMISRSQPMKPKTHGCSVCGQEFALGQALGGHMRRHRDEAATTGKTVDVAVMKKQQIISDQNQTSRGLCLDLNLMPYENDLRLWPIVS